VKRLILTEIAVLEVGFYRFSRTKSPSAALEKVGIGTLGWSENCDSHGSVGFARS
jgi:hypothetical protein